MYYFIISICISIISIISIIFVLIRQQGNIEKKLHEATINSSQDFMSKMEFFFKNFSQAREESSKQAISVIEPISKTLEKLQRQIDESQRYTISNNSVLHTNLDKIIELQKNMDKETSKLINIFRKPNVSGKWGEVQLQRIAELTGMLPFCEFDCQNTDIEGIRPDMTVNLPNGGYIFIDAKTPLDAYFKIEADSENDTLKKDNLKAIKNHIYLLSNKKYWTKAKSPDFVIMFIPIENIWLSALEEEPEVMEYATNRKVVVATPMTLIGLLKVIFDGWKQVRFAEEAENLKKSLEFIKEHTDSIGKYIIEINKSNAQTTEKFLKIQGIIGIISSEINNYVNFKPEIKQEDINSDDITDIQPIVLDNSIKDEEEDNDVIKLPSMLM